MLEASFGRNCLRSYLGRIKAVAISIMFTGRCGSACETCTNRRWAVRVQGEVVACNREHSSA